ncbi:AI-2E family transporter [Spongiibacter nanhainus]|uniref:AI-2E family transporter n=2 Tax=Spongiibacter nanhainus TaxID=2794344 RepID=A0A7T4R480_9GAMM|nr:AI-2E family transporter [Spongiibacter nanhainus]
MWGAAALVLVYLILRLLGPILMPFALASVFAYIGDPLVDRLEERKLGRTPAVALVFVGLTLVTALGVLITLPLLLDQTQLLIQRLYGFVAWVQESGLPALRQYFDLPEQSSVNTAKEALSKHWSAAGGLLMYVWQQVSGSSAAVLTWLANMTLVPVVTFYLLRDWDHMMARIRALLPRRVEPKVVGIARECDEILGAFARGQFMVMLSLALVYMAGLWLVGLDLALVLGLIAGLASIVPYLGFIVGILAAGLAAYFQFDSWWPLLGVAGVFGAGQVLESVYLTPTLVGDKIGLHPVIVIFAVLAGGQLFGFLGILLALPAAAVIKVMVLHAHEAYQSSDFYAAAGDVKESPE